MEDTRKGFLTPEQEKEVDEVIELKGLAEALDGPAITLTDNQILERAKVKIVEKFGEDILPYIYNIIDEVLVVLLPKK